jgi:hypothetical protein
MTSPSKKRGRPLGSKNKPAAERVKFKRASELNDKAKVVLLTKKIATLNIIVNELQLIRQRLHSLVDNYEHKEIQYRAVIDYLETKLRLKDERPTV